MKRVLSVEKHELSKQRLQVRPYYSELGVLPSGFDSSQPRQPLPQDLVLDCPPEVVAFLFKSKSQKHKVLTPVYSLLHLPCTDFIEYHRRGNGVDANLVSTALSQDIGRYALAVRTVRTHGPCERLVSIGL